MKIRCADVVVQKRVRNDLGELDGLMESIRLLGLLQPIGITKQNVLVFGQRRLIACGMLGHEEIEAKVKIASEALKWHLKMRCRR